MSRLRLLLVALWFPLAGACSDGPGRSFALPTAPSASGTPAMPVSPRPPLPISPVAGPVYKPGTGQTVGPGEAVTFMILAGDPVCYENWDLSGRCRLFELTPDVDGQLEVNVRRTTPIDVDVLDVFIVSAEEPAVIAFSGWDSEQAVLRAVAGRRYGIFVMSYPAFPQEFTLTLDLH